MIRAGKYKKMVWKIQRYARQKTVHKGGDSIEWEVCMLGSFLFKFGDSNSNGLCFLPKMNFYM